MASMADGGQEMQKADVDHPIDWAISLAFLKLSLALIAVGTCAYLLSILALAPEQHIRAVLAAAYALVACAAWSFLARGRLRAAVWILGAGAWTVLTAAAFFLGGVSATPLILYPPIILLAGWMISVRAGAAVAIASAAATLAMVIVEWHSMLPTPPAAPPLLRWIIECAVFALTALLVSHFVRSYRARLDEVRNLGDALERHAAELETREADLNRAQAVAQVGSWTYDLAADSMWLSPETCRIFGLPAGTRGSHESYLTRVHPEDRKAASSAWQQALMGGAAFDHEHRILVGDSIRWVRQMAQMEHDRQGVIVRALGSTQDVTLARQRDAELMAAQRQLAATLDAIPDLLFEVGPDGRYYKYHSPNTGLAAAAPSELLGRTVAEKMPPAAADVVMAALREAGELGQSHGMMFELALPQGQRWFELSVACKPVAEGEEPRFIVISRDVTLRRRAQDEVVQLNASLEERVRERTAQLQKANQELEEFSYTISHDLRAPLRSMVGFSGILLEDLAEKLNPDSRDLLGRIAASGNKMSRLIDGVLEYSRLAKSDVVRRQVDLDALVEGLVGEMREAYPRAEFVVHPLGRVQADPVMMRKIFSNLIDNALKFSAGCAAPKVEIGTQSATAAVEYFVRDNGVGFDMKHADHLFKLFTRLHNGAHIDSTSAGLAIVKRLVERHDGRVRAEAAPGHGATFAFSL